MNQREKNNRKTLASKIIYRLSFLLVPIIFISFVGAVLPTINSVSLDTPLTNLSNLVGFCNANISDSSSLFIGYNLYENDSLVESNLTLFSGVESNLRSSDDYAVGVADASLTENYVVFTGSVGLQVLDKETLDVVDTQADTFFGFSSVGATMPYNGTDLLFVGAGGRMFKYEPSTQTV